MKLLFSSTGIKNTNIHDALVDVLGKPTAASNAHFTP
jgi:dipeptidase E